MGWAEARTAIASYVGTVTIAAPVVQVIKRVYELPPASLADSPCAILYPPSVTVERGEGQRWKFYRLRIRVITHDAELEQAAGIVDSFREAMVDEWDEHLTLGALGYPVTGQAISEAQSFQYGNKTYTGFDMFLDLTIEEGKEFGH